MIDDTVSRTRKATRGLETALVSFSLPLRAYFLYVLVVGVSYILVPPEYLWLFSDLVPVGLVLFGGWLAAHFVREAVERRRKG